MNIYCKLVLICGLLAGAYFMLPVERYDSQYMLECPPTVLDFSGDITTAGTYYGIDRGVAAPSPAFGLKCR
jgi:hypothetical protein